MTGERAREGEVIGSPGVWAWGEPKFRGAIRVSGKPNPEGTIGVKTGAAGGFLEEWRKDSHRTIS